MASTLLAVDDSVTMRKVLEITFAGQDYKVVTANSSDAALQKLKSDKPDLVIADGTLEPKNGYDLCKEIKKISPSTPVIFLSSKQNPFDAAKGSGAQVDDHMDKPFDTQQLIDKVKKLLTGGVVAAKPAAATVVSNTAQTTPSMPAAMAGSTAATAPLAQTRTGAQTTPGGMTAGTPGAAGGTAATPMQRAKTLIYNPPAAVGAQPAQAGTAKQPAAPIAPTPVAGLPLQPRNPEPAPARTETLTSPQVSPQVVQTAASPMPIIPGVAINGQMAGKLEQLGLTPAQVEAVLALSREVVERVVWEVVPVLAESIIREEISRLIK